MIFQREWQEVQQIVTRKKDSKEDQEENKTPQVSREEQKRPSKSRLQNELEEKEDHTKSEIEQIRHF